MIIPFIIFILCILFLGFGDFGKKDSDKEEEKLQAIVEEVMVDIDNGDYDDAYIKANTIYYTEGYSSDIEEKWDNTREALLEQIEEAKNKN